MRDFLRGINSNPSNSKNPNINNTSKFSIAGFISIGAMRAPTPGIRSKLKILEPSMLPTEISISFLNAAIAEVASSGMLVPKATTLIDIILSLTPNLYARLSAPFTINHDPATSPPHPASIDKTAGTGFIPLISFSSLKNIFLSFFIRKIIYATNIISKKSPSKVVILRLYMNKENTRLTKTRNKKLIFIVLTLTGITIIMAVMPRTSPIFEILDPITLPIARSGIPCKSALILTKSSGADVPNETIVIPINKGDILKYFARELPPRIRILPKNNNKTIPDNIKR